jgi:hypothetical protein
MSALLPWKPPCGGLRSSSDVITVLVRTRVSRYPVAPLIFPAAPAEAEVVPARLRGHGRVASPGPRHDLRGGPAVPDEIGHDPHGPVGVGEEGPVPRAEVVRRLAAGGREPVLRALAVADREPAAGEEGAGQGLPLGSSERPLPLRADQVIERRLEDVAEEVARLDEVVAGVEVAVLSSATPRPQVGPKMQTVPARPSQPARAPSMFRTNVVPTSRLTHLSKIATRNRPHCSGRTDRSVTPPPSRSTIGMNWTNSALTSSRKNR